MISFYYIFSSNFDIVFDIHLGFIQPESLPILDLKSIIVLSYLGFLSVVATFMIVSRYRLYETNTRDFYKFFFMFFLLTLAIIVLIPGFRFSASALIPVSLSVPMSRYFISFRRRIFKEIVFDLFLLSVIVNALEPEIFNFLNL